MTKKKEEAQALLYNNFPAFTGEVFQHLNPNRTFHDNWHLHAIAKMLQKTMSGEINRLIITLPPRHLKSTMASIAAPAFILGHDPLARILCVQYGEELAVELSNHTRSIMEALWYRELFPGTDISKGKQTEDKISTSKGGYRWARHLYGPIMGLGGNFIICDDPAKGLDVHSPAMREKVWTTFNESVMSRLDDPNNDVIIVVAQRLHEDDLIGRLKTSGGWTELKIPAETQIDREYDVGKTTPHVFKAGSVLDPQRLPKEALLQRRKELGASAYAAQYLQEPIAPGGTVFNWNWFKFYPALELKCLQFDFVFHSWDVASSLGENASYSVCTRWGLVGEDKFYLLGVVRERLTTPNLLKRACQLYEHEKPDFVIVEKDGIGSALWQPMREKYGARVEPAPAENAKTVRAEKVAIMIEDGAVHVPVDALWLEVFRNEITAFPNGKHDDQVDSMTQMLGNAKKAIKRVLEIGRLRHTENVINPANFQKQMQARLFGGPRRLFLY